MLITVFPDKIINTVANYKSKFCLGFAFLLSDLHPDIMLIYQILSFTKFLNPICLCTIERNYLIYRTLVNREVVLFEALTRYKPVAQFSAGRQQIVLIADLS